MTQCPGIPQRYNLGTSFMTKINSNFKQSGIYLWRFLEIKQDQKSGQKKYTLFLYCPRHLLIDMGKVTVIRKGGARDLRRIKVIVD